MSCYYFVSLKLLWEILFVVVPGFLGSFGYQHSNREYFHKNSIFFSLFLFTSAFPVHIRKFPENGRKSGKERNLLTEIRKITNLQRNLHYRSTASVLLP